jgi:hypothetical protein
MLSDGHKPFPAILARLVASHLMTGPTRSLPPAGAWSRPTVAVAESLLDPAPDFDWCDVFAMHSHRLTGDVDANPSAHSVGVPGESPIRGAASDKAVMVGPMTELLAAAEARKLPENLGVAGGELVGRSHGAGLAR